MNLATGTVTVNAAFLQEIKDDAREFRQLLVQSADLLSPALVQHASVKRVVDVLSQLRDQLALHFTLEEAYGYFEDAIHAAPQLSEQAEHLRNQHQSLFVDYCRVVEAAEQLLYGERDDESRALLARLFRNFLADLQLHEAREQDLIVAAFNDDLGAGD